MTLLLFPILYFFLIFAFWKRPLHKLIMHGIVVAGIAGLALMDSYNIGFTISNPHGAALVLGSFILVIVLDLLIHHSWYWLMKGIRRNRAPQGSTSGASHPIRSSSERTLTLAPPFPSPESEDESELPEAPIAKLKRPAPPAPSRIEPSPSRDQPSPNHKRKPLDAAVVLALILLGAGLLAGSLTTLGVRPAATPAPSFLSEEFEALDSGLRCEVPSYWHEFTPQDAQALVEAGSDLLKDHDLEPAFQKYPLLYLSDGSMAQAPLPTNIKLSVARGPAFPQKLLWISPEECLTTKKATAEQNFAALDLPGLEIELRRVELVELSGYLGLLTVATMTIDTDVYEVQYLEFHFGDFFIYLEITYPEDSQYRTVETVTEVLNSLFMSENRMRSAILGE